MQRRMIEIHDPMKNEIEETCQLRKMMQVSMMSVFLGLGLVSIPGMKEREKVCIYTKAYSFYILPSRALRALRGPC